MPYRVTHEHATVSVREFAMTNAARGGYELRTEQQLIYAETAPRARIAAHSISSGPANLAASEALF